VIEHEERELIESIIEFGDTVVREIMVPRPDMVVVPNDATVAAALDLAIEHGFSRLPVLGADESDITGLAYAKDLMGAERDGRGDAAAVDLARQVAFVPENKPVARLMRDMQAGKFHLAVVADEYGEVAGLVTLEDCLEELVGEIVDEYDDDLVEIERLADGDLLVAGGLNIDDLADALGVAIAAEDVDSVGGLIFSTLGRVPVVGDEVEVGPCRLTAVEVEGRRVRSVRVSCEVEPDADRQHESIAD